MAILAFIASAVFFASLYLGPVPISPFAGGDMERRIIADIRLPRSIAAFLMGIGLGASGVVLQGMLRNPLADPYILGLSSGATLSAAIGLMGGLTVFGMLTVPALAFCGAMASGLMVGLMGWRRGGLWPERLLLAGVGLGFLFSAVLSLLMSVSSNEGLRRAITWIFGDLGMVGPELLPYGAALVLAGLGVALSRAKALNSLMLGDDLAHSLGFSPRKETTVLFVAVGLMTASSVSIGGMVGFIGLLMPHVMRFFFGPDSRLLIPASALGGGALLCSADLLGRVMFRPAEIPAGIVTAIIGAPYFLYLLRRRDVIG